MSKQDGPNIRYAVVGDGPIAEFAVLPAFERATRSSQLVALISADGVKRAKLTQKHGIPLSGAYTDLEHVLEAGKVDAVYIVTPCALHREHAVRAAAAGVHVLCERPLAPSLRDCEAIVRACEDARVKLMVAHRLDFGGETISVLDLMRQKALENERVFDSMFGHMVRADDARFIPELGGGACLDLGVYCINAARHVFAAEPISVAAVSTWKGGTDHTTTATLYFEEYRTAQFVVSGSGAFPSSFRIVARKGDQRVEPAFDRARFGHSFTADETTRPRTFGKRDPCAPQLDYFSACVRDDEAPVPSGAEGMADVRVIEAVRQSAITEKVVSLEPLDYTFGLRPKQGRTSSA